MPSAKLNPMARHAIARAYFAGARPSEIAQDWGVSLEYVLAQARWLEKRRLERQAKIAAKRLREFQHTAQIIHVSFGRSKPEIVPLKSAVGREMGIKAYQEKGKVTVPYVSIIHGK
uniref:Uncharacterized protein n=1 Tax=Chelativorans sp. (strain BNC1) TaxID=266779 RepID=Q11LV1_CHESB